jgi:hypothetical protein
MSLGRMCVWTSILNIVTILPIVSRNRKRAEK